MTSETSERILPILLKNKRKKIIFLILIFLICFFSFKVTVAACNSNEIEQCYIIDGTKKCSCYPGPESNCLEKGTCNYVCGYLQFRNDEETPRFIGVYKHSNNKWEVTASTGSGGDNKGPDEYYDVFSTSGKNIYSQTTFFDGCLNYGYYDTEVRNEICFDNDGKYCQGYNQFFPGYSDFKYKEVFKVHDIKDSLMDDLIQNLGNGIASYIDQAKIIDELSNTILYDKINSNRKNIYSNYSYMAYSNIKEISEYIAEEVVKKINKESNDDFSHKTDNDTCAIPLPPEDGNQSPYWNSYLLNVRKRMLFCGGTDDFLDDDYDNMPDDMTRSLAFIIKIVLNQETFDDNPGNQTEHCYSLLGNPKDKGTDSTPASPAYYLQFVFNIIKYAAIILVIVLEILDFVKAIASKDNDIMSKALNKLFIRLIICVVIFFVPIILEFLFTLIDIYSPSTCGIS